MVWPFGLANGGPWTFQSPHPLLSETGRRHGLVTSSNPLSYAKKNARHKWRLDVFTIFVVLRAEERDVFCSHERRLRRLGINIQI